MSVLDELEIIIRQKDGKVLASIPQLNLYAKAANIDAALAALERKEGGPFSRDGRAGAWGA